MITKVLVLGGISDGTTAVRAAYERVMGTITSAG